MSGLLDTAMIVRYMVEPRTPAGLWATRIIDEEEGLEVTDAALAETAYVLATHYRVPREEVVDHLIDFLSKRNVSPFAGRKETTIRGLLLCRPSGRVSIRDALIWAAARSSGSPVYTLDQRFPREGVEIRTP